jgi:uracil-DNA glycosylase
VPAQTNDISERYLRKAIAEMNELGHEIAEAAGSDRAPVLGSGHPLAEIFLLKHRPQDAP